MKYRGAASALLADQREEVRRIRDDEEGCSPAEAAKLFKVSANTVRRA